VERQQKPDKDGWLDTPCGRERGGKKEDSCYKYRVTSHAGKLSSLSYGWGIEEPAQDTHETCARVSGKATKLSVLSLQNRAVNAVCRSLTARKLPQLKAALRLHKYILGNRQALKRFWFEQCKGTYRRIQL